MELLSDGNSLENHVKGKKMKFTSSYKIFMKYVELEPENSAPNVLKIFTNECLEEWLSSRPGKKIKHPLESFQRVLYAHIKGADHRKPFPEPVEKELIKHLRNILYNPWKDLARRYQAKIGMRGFRQLGFHESSRKKNQEELKTVVSAEDCLIIHNDSFENVDSTFNPVQVEANPFELNSFFRATLKQPRRNLLVPWDVLVHRLQTYVPMNHRHKCLISMNKNNVNIYSPAVYFYLNNIIDENDFKFSSSFMFPSEDEQFFGRENPVGMIVIGYDHSIVMESMQIIDMFRGSILNRHFYQLFSSYVSLVYSFIGQLPAIANKGTVWKRHVLKRCDGSSMVTLIQITAKGKGFVVYMQDQSHRFPDVFKSICFI